MPREKNTNKAETRRGGSAAVLPDWMTFPTLALAFEPSPSETIAYLTAKHKEYESLETTGTATDRVRARLIASGYTRTSALLQELETARTQFLKQQETLTAETR